MLNLKSILYAITPENIKSIPLVNISLGIFVDYIMSSNELSQRISAIFDVDSMPDESEAQKKAKEILRKGTYCTWIYTLYTALEKLAINADVVNDIQRLGYEQSVLLKGLDKFLTPEIINTSRAYSQKVGTSSALKYMYYFGRYLETGSFDLDLEIIEDKPFVMHYKGSMSPSMFYGIVKPLSHPIGWVESYEYIMSLLFQDYYGIDVGITYDRIEFNSYNRWVIFIPDDNIDRIYEEFMKVRVNPATGKYYKQEEVQALVTIFTLKTATDLQQVINDDGTTNREITFSDGSKIFQQGSDPAYIKLVEPDGTTQEWDENWIFFGESTTNFKFLYEDDLESIEVDFDFGKVSDIGKVGATSEYIGIKPDNCFKVGGFEYPFMVGADEAQTVVANRTDVYQTLCSNFDTKIEYKIYQSSYIRISDDYGHVLEYYIDYPNADRMKAGEISLNTLGLQGFNYSVQIAELGGTKYGFRASGLNQHNPILEFTNVQTEQTILKVWGKANLQDNKWGEELTLRLTLTDAEGTKITNNLEEPTTEFYMEFPSAVLVSGKFRLDVDAVNTYGRPRAHAFYEGLDLWSFSDIEPSVTFLVYSEYESLPRVESSPLESVLDMYGANSTSEYVTTKIGQLYDGSYDAPDLPVQDFVDSNLTLPWDIPELDDKIIRGAYIEGSSYAKSFYTDEKYWNEETFIATGFGHYPIENPDFIVMDSQKYAVDTFQLESVAAHTGYYIVSDVAEGDYRGRYLYSSDNCYLYSKEMYVKISLEAFNGQDFRIYIVDKRTRWKYFKSELPTPSRNGYQFRYWSLSQQGAEIPEEYAFESDTTLYAVYLELPSEVTIRFNTQGGSTIPSKTLSNTTTFWGDLVETIETPTLANYDFLHWSLKPNGSPIENYTQINKNLTVYAVWALHHYTYKISFRENGGSVIPDIEVLDNVPFVEWSKFVFAPYRVGYTFKHWSLTDGGLAVDSQWMATSDTTLYAVWEEIQVLTLIFDSLGGTYVKKMDINPLERSALPVPERKGYVFQHWSDVPKGSAIVLESLHGLRSKKLYAVWRKLS